ncbi:hypothetical protein PRIPAC_96657 [Pristionchus pacificus]|uniref:Uncharacterized protein n=1 Tax=Pristionchus pacificus TaxID=54126 RepID=A0A2A6CU95_PRIPA|nr:hypothetical protein PRIPAC_96657 [Pristionchus pacificus]|eukprot:PDM81755.1 hypothetical protein PRIPAC_37597 [Pristionchus pacificus]
MEDETPPNTGAGTNDNFFSSFLKRITDFISSFGMPRTEVPHAAVAEEVKRKSEILVQQKFLKREEQELRKSDIRSKLNRGGDPSSKMWIEFIISCGYDEEARKKELLEEQLLYHATEKLSRIGSPESKIEMEKLMSENALKKEESQIIRSLWKLKYQMWDLCQFYDILRFEYKRFDTYKVHVEEYVSKCIEDAMILGKRIRTFCADPNNNRDSAEIFQPELLDRLRDNLVAYYYQLKVMMCNKPTKEYKASYRELEESIWGLQKIEWNNKTKEWILDASKKAKMKKQSKLKKQPAVEIEEESNEGEMEPIIQGMEEETISDERNESTTNGSP